MLKALALSLASGPTARVYFRPLESVVLPLAIVNKNLAIANRSRVSCAQYAEGIYRHKYYTVTLKSRLRVTQGHWKRNHWIYHTHLVVVELFDAENISEMAKDTAIVTIEGE